MNGVGTETTICVKPLNNNNVTVHLINKLQELTCERWDVEIGHMFVNLSFSSSVFCVVKLIVCTDGASHL